MSNHYEQTSGAARAVLAQALGEDPDTITNTNARWTTLLQEGVIVNLTIRRWRGKTRLTLDDLGVTTNGEEQLYHDLLNLGDKLLLPKKILRKLASIDSGARKAIEGHGFRTYWGTFVPATAYDSCNKELERFEALYFQMRDQIVREYDTIMQKLMDDYAEAARVAYKRRHKLQDFDELSRTASIDLDFRYLPEDEFVDTFMQHITSLIPNRDEIGSSFAFETDLQFIPLPSMLEADRLLAAELELERQEIDEKITIERQRNQKIRQMHNDVIQRAERQKNVLVDSFLQDIVRQLRGLIYDTCVQVSESMKRNGYLHPRSVVQLQKMISQVGDLNFFGDQDADAMIGQLQQLLDTKADDRSPVEIAGVLRSITTVTRQSLLALGDRPRSARALGVSDDPPPELVRRARCRLGLVDLDIETSTAERRQTRLISAHPSQGR